MKKNTRNSLLMISIIFGLFLILMIPNKVNASDNNGNFVIVLDPGHGGSDSGAIGGGLREDQVNFKLAYYAKQELEKYEDVKVYLTRYNDCPTIYNRVEIAKKYNADVLISMHINSSDGNGSSRGAAIWVTQDNTKVEYKQKASEMAQIILAKINKIGIINNGVKIRSGSSDERYDSGVIQDYYGIIRYAQRIKMRSILIEHCYIDNAEDRSFIDTDDKIKKLAQADVQGIVDAYQLIKKSQGITLKSIKLKQPEINIEITSENESPTYFMPITYMPSNATNKIVYWYTSNPKVATVNGGMIYAKGQGEVMITAISGNNQKIAICKVIVSRPTKPLKNISLKRTNINVNMGENGFIGAVYDPVDADDKVLYWTSSNENVAKVYKGVVIPISKGTVTLTAISRAGGKTASCKVNIVDKDFVSIESIKMITNELTLKPGGNSWLGVKYNPSNVTDKTLYWTSSNENVAKVYEGTVTAMGNGVATITATSRDGEKQATCQVNVKSETTVLESLNLKTTNIDMKKGEMRTIYALYTPNNVTDKTLYWTSSNENVAKVYEGTVTAVGNGVATITATSRDGGKQATCQVNVNNGLIKIQNISLKSNIEMLLKNQKQTIYAVYNPNNVTDKTLYWTSSNENVAKVYEGTVTAVGNGIATITATSRDGGKQASCSIVVINLNTSMEKIKLLTEEKKMKKGEISTIYAVYTPNNAIDKTLYWTSSDEKVVKVYEGTVTAVGNGEATITATSRDGGKQASCKISVSN